MEIQKFSYDGHARTSDPVDFWSQVKRTVAGKPISEKQIALIVDAVQRGLELNRGDFLLDVGCGNGALSDRIFADCRGGLGVDLSAYLIDVACQNFGAHPAVAYRTANAVDLVRTYLKPNKFTKLLCYGAFMYFSDIEAEELLSDVRQRFSQIERCFLGNLPDRARVKDFYHASQYVSGIEDSHETVLGVWRSETQMLDLAARSGWKAAIRRMPAEFTGAPYRYDVVLTPAP